MAMVGTNGTTHIGSETKRGCKAQVLERPLKAWIGPSRGRNCWTLSRMRMKISSMVIMKR